MQKQILIALLALAVANISPAQTADAKPTAAKKGTASQAGAAKAEQELKKLEGERNEAIKKSDTATLERLSSDDYAVINLAGQLRSRNQLVQGFKTGAIKIPSREVDELNVRVYGDTAVVTGRVTQKGTSEGKDISGQYRFTRVYVKQQGTWKPVAAQETTISQ